MLRRRWAGSYEKRRTRLAALLAPLSHDWRGHARPGIADWRTRRALDYIHAYLPEKLSLISIASEAGTSPYHLCRQFRATVGISLWQYVLRERARYAASLMANPKISLLEICNATGFDSYAGFIAAVRNEFGCSPSQLRRA